MRLLGFRLLFINIITINTDVIIDLKFNFVFIFICFIIYFRDKDIFVAIYYLWQFIRKWFLFIRKGSLVSEWKSITIQDLRFNVV